MLLYFWVNLLICRNAITGQSIVTDPTGKKYIKPLFIKGPGETQTQLDFLCFDESNGYTVIGGVVQDTPKAFGFDSGGPWVGIMGIKTSQNSDSTKDFSSLVLFVQNNWGYVSGCKFTKTAVSALGRPVLFVFKHQGTNQPQHSYFIDPQDAATNKWKELFTIKSNKAVSPTEGKYQMRGQQIDIWPTAAAIHSCFVIIQANVYVHEQLIECYKYRLDNQAIESYGAKMGSSTNVIGSTINVFYRSDPYYYIGLGMMHRAGENNKICILKWNPTGTTDFSTINQRYAPGDANDEGKMRISCMDTGEAANPQPPVGIPTYETQTINQITKFSPNSRTVALSLKINPQNQLDPFDGKFMQFHGECIANSDEYYSVSIDTIVNQKSNPIALYAKSDTDYYFLWHYSLGSANIVTAAKIHFDPDTSNCATQGYSTPLKITFKVVDNVCPYDGRCRSLYGSWSTKFGAIMFVGGTLKNRYFTPVAGTYNVGFISGVHESEFESYISEYVGTTSKGMFRSDLSQNWAADRDLWKETYTNSITLVSGASLMKDALMTGLEDHPFHVCAEKLTKKRAPYVDGYTKVFYYNNVDTSGNQFSYVENTDIFEIADAANCPITSCAIQTFSNPAKVQDAYFCTVAYSPPAATDFVLDTAQGYKIKVDSNKIHESVYICMKCNTQQTEVQTFSNIFKIKVDAHPCNTDGIIYDASKAINVLGDDKKELNYKYFIQYDGSKTYQLNSELPQWTKTLPTEQIFTAKSTGAEAVGGCAQFANTYTLTKVLKKDGVSVISPTDYQNIISVNGATGALTIKDYSNVNIANFDEAQIFVKAENTHFKLTEQKVAVLSFKYHYCNYKGFKDKSKEKKEIVLTYDTWVPWQKDPIKPEPSSVSTKRLSLKSEQLIESEDKTKCDIIDYKLVRVLKKEDASGKKEVLEQKFWKDVISLDDEKGELIIQKWGGADLKILDTLTLVFKAKTEYAISNEFELVVLTIKENLVYQPEPKVINNPPYFADFLSDIDLVRDYKSGDTFPLVEYEFPEIKDRDGDKAEIIIREEDIDANWIIFEPGSTIIVFNPNRVPYRVLKKGEDTEIPFKLVDERGAFSTHKLLVMAKQYIPPPKPFIPVYDPPKPKPKPIPPPPIIEPETPAGVLPLRATIDEISTLGLVKIKFNQEFKIVDDGGKRILQENAGKNEYDKYFKPILEVGQFEKDSNFNQSKYDFVWQVTEFDTVENVFTMQINFTDALHISKDAQFKDFLLIEFTDYSKFVSVAHDLPIDKYSRKINSIVKRQMPNDQASQNFDKGTDGADKSMTATTVIMFSLNFVFAGAVKEIIGAIMSLQIVIHIALLTLPFPGNMSNFIQKLKPIASFNVVKQLSKLTEYILPQDKETQNKNKPLIIPPAQDLGMKTHNTIANLTNIFFMMTLIKFDILKIFIFALLKPWTSRFNNKLIQLRKSIFFGQIITMCTGGFIPMAIACYLGFSQPVKTGYGEKVSNFLNYLVFFLIFIFYPLAMIANIMVSQDTLQNESYKQMWGPLYAPNRVQNRWQRAFRLQFILRRFLVLLIGFMLYKQPIFQVILVTALNLYALIYMGVVEPFKDWRLNKNETWNEGIVLILTIHIYCFTDAMPNIEAQYAMGWSFSFFMTLFLIINGQRVLRDMFRKFKLLFVRNKRKLERYLAKKKSKSKRRVTFAEVTEDGEPVTKLRNNQRPTQCGKLEVIEEVSDIYEESRQSLIDPKIKEEDDEYSSSSESEISSSDGPEESDSNQEVDPILGGETNQLLDKLVQEQPELVQQLNEVDELYKELENLNQEEQALEEQASKLSSQRMIEQVEDKLIAQVEEELARIGASADSPLSRKKLQI